MQHPQKRRFPPLAQQPRCRALTYLQAAHAADESERCRWNDGFWGSVSHKITQINQGLVTHFGYIGHHLIVAIIDHIPNGWVMFNGDI